LALVQEVLPLLLLPELDYSRLQQVQGRTTQEPRMKMLARQALTRRPNGTM
jgi:hypothetical protein